jgi:hypothetical protein
MIVLAGTSGTNPSYTDPTLQNCVWNFVTGWQCEKVGPTTTQQQPPPNYSPEEPLTGDISPTSAMLPVLANAMGRDCGCCGGSSGGNAVSPSSTSVAVATTTAKKCDECGYTNQEAVMALVLGTILFLLLAK